MSFTSEIEVISSTRRKFKITASADVVNQALQSSLIEVQGRAELRGFRKGHVPANLLRKFYGEEIYRKAAEAVVEQSYGQAVREAGLQIVSQPEIELGEQFAEGKELKFTALVDVNPTVEITGYKELVLKAPPQQVTDSAIEESLARMRKVHARFEKIAEARPAVESDVVLVSYAVKGEKSKSNKKSEHENERFDLANSRMPDEFKRAIAGMNVGETKNISIPFSADYFDKQLAGSSVDIKLTLNAIEQMFEPEMDDAFARKVGASDVEDLSRRVRDALMKEEEKRRLEIFGEQIVDQILAGNKFEVPENLIESTIDRLIYDENARIGHKTDDSTLKNKEVRGKLRETAEQQVQAVLAIGNIARMEGIVVEDDEVAPAILEMASSMGVAPQDLLKRGGRMLIEEARGRVLINKAIKHLVGISQIETEVPAST